MNRYWALIVILLAAVVFSPDPGSSRAISAAHDFAHAPVFGCVSVLLLIWFRSARLMQHRPVIAQYLFAIAGGAVLGLITEVVQAFTGRDSSWRDLRADILGAVAFAAMFALVDDRIGKKVLRASLCAIGVALMIAHSLPFAQTTLAYVRRNQEFPTLFDARDSTPDHFAGRMYARFAYEPLPQPFALSANEQALHISFKAGPWPGMYLDEPRLDWTAYEKLALDLTNPGDEPLKMVIRIHDKAHDHRFEDRFNRSFELAARTRVTIEFPLADIENGPTGRKLDLTQIDQIIVFTAEQNEGRDMYVSRLWLH